MSADDLIADLGSPRPEIRALAAQKLGAGRTRVAVPALIHALRDLSPAVRQSAAAALGWIGDPRAVPALCRALEDPSSDVSASAFGAVVTFGIQAAPELCEALCRGGWERSSLVVEALVRISAPAAGSVSVLLRSPVWQVRREAAALLGKMGEPSVVPALIRALMDEAEWVRASAAEALGQLREPRGVSALIETLADRSEGVRLRAIGALAALGDPRAEDGLLEALARGPRRLRIAAADALGSLGTERSILPLIAAMEGAVGFPAARALYALADRCPAPALRAALPSVSFWSRMVGLSPGQNDLYVALAQRIEAATVATSDLPVPAWPGAEAENLPRVAGPPPSRPFTAARAVAGKGWRRWLRPLGRPRRLLKRRSL